ncbi:hypothetical protein BZM27_27590 [Paraburkholderia steynii]|uniref:Phage capsid-like C-terminal domain-containing protein n=1 Tax=Paraburkholderia steynii TaxID=1245441 RepID=A0A4R0XER0_9BURK|nr:hypothetical protein BZM27_27590 [Paraburkholderia steynii]
MQKWIDGTNNEMKSLGEKLAGFQVSLIDLGQKLAGREDRGPGGGSAGDSPGQAFVKAFDMQAFRDHKATSSGKVAVPSFLTKAALTTAEAGTAASPTGAPGQRGWTSRVMSAFTTVPFGASAAVYPQVNSVTSAAAEAPENTTKAETAIDAELITASVPTIAHFVRASLQVLDDSQSLAMFIDSVLRIGVLQKADMIMAAQLLALGQAVAAPAGSNLLDAAAYAAAAMSDAGRQATNAIFNTNDYLGLMCTKGTTGEYIFDGPLTDRLPLTFTYSGAVTAGSVLVVDGGAGVVLERQQPTVEVSRFNGNDFTTNMVTVLGEARLLLALYDVAGVAVGSVTPPSGGATAAARHTAKQ